MKKLFTSIFKIFKFSGKLILGFYQFVLTSFIILFLGLIVFSLINQEQFTVKPNSILKIDITGDLVEQRTAPTSFNQLFSPFSSQPPPETLIFDVFKAIDAASLDPNIALLQLDLSKMESAGLDNLQVLGTKLKQFKASGKEIIIAQDNYMQLQYYLAAHADTIILNPEGGVLMHGFGAYKLYFKDLLDKLQISYNVFQVGDYKSALEPFTRSSMSKEDREQSSKWLSGLWDIYTTDINRLRILAPDALLKYTNYTPSLLRETDGDAGALALKIGLVDYLKYRHEISDFLKDKLQISEGETINTVNLTNYLSTIPDKQLEDNISRIAVIIAEGNIVAESQSTGVISSELLIKKIRSASNNKNIKGLVLRINSGGGSAFASEVIRQELLQFKQTGKPLVVSMGRLAASGAYWISANADEIWASPATITGSIGIFGAIPTFEKGLSKIGVYSDGTGTTPIASGLNLTRPLPNNLKQSIQMSVEHGYEKFLTIVSEGRNIKMDKVEQIAQGRVYIGRDARGLGLVDMLGNLDGAIDTAAQLAKIENYEPLYIQASPSFKTRMLELLSAQTHILLSQRYEQNNIVNYILSAVDNLVEFSNIKDPNHIYVYGGEYKYN